MSGPRQAAPRVARPCRARANPFRVRRVLALRYRLDEGWEPLLDRLARLGRRAALVGPQGSGKTTLLEELEQRLETQGWRVLRLRLARDRRRPGDGDWRRLEGLGPGDLISVDGLEQLPWWSWRRLERLSRRAGGLVATSHRPGRLPVLRRHRTDPRLLEELVAELVGRRSAESMRPELERLFAAHRGNLRDCLRSLYDRWAHISPSAAWGRSRLPDRVSTPPMHRICIYDMHRLWRKERP